MIPQRSGRLGRGALERLPRAVRFWPRELLTEEGVFRRVARLVPLKLVGS